MLLYPTETIYALGVNALLEAEIAKLFQLKGRAEGNSVSWLVRDIEDIAHYGVLSETAAKIAQQFLPGPLTLILPPKDTVPEYRRQTGEVSFRISPDPVAQQVIGDFMAEHHAPLTCTSANVSGQPTLETPDEILKQFAAHHPDTPIDWSMISVVDDGPRTGQPSTVVKVVDEQIEILREGAIPAFDIFSILK